MYVNYIYIHLFHNISNKKRKKWVWCVFSQTDFRVFPPRMRAGMELLLPSGYGRKNKMLSHSWKTKEKSLTINIIKHIRMRYGRWRELCLTKHDIVLGGGSVLSIVPLSANVNFPFSAIFFIFINIIHIILFSSLVLFHLIPYHSIPTPRISRPCRDSNGAYSPQCLFFWNESFQLEQIGIDMYNDPIMRRSALTM